MVVLYEEKKVRGFLKELEAKLGPLYTMPNAPGGHDVEHVHRMVALGERIRRATQLSFDQGEYQAAVWLHNLDRLSMVRGVEKLIPLNHLLEYLLKESRFDYMARARIIDAVLQHSKKDDEPNDTPLLTALRIADKLDRLGPLGIVSGVAHSASMPLYDPANPFGYGTTVEGQMKTVYQNLFRMIEWVGMLPSDTARGLIDEKDMRAYLSFVRAFGAEIARRHNVLNESEDDIKQALGEYYEMYN